MGAWTYHDALALATILGAQATRLQFMNVVLLRVGIDMGAGGALSPMFDDGSFEFIPIPDTHCLDDRTYGNTVGRCGSLFIDCLPDNRRRQLQHHPMHVDPEFASFTYGDPTALKRRLSTLKPGDLLVFYAGLRPWEDEGEAALHIVGYFEVSLAGIAAALGDQVVHEQFAENFHVRHPQMYREQRDRLTLVKGTEGSRLLAKAIRISSYGKDRRGRRLHVLAPEMQKIFGDFGGRTSIQRCSPRWVAADMVETAAKFVRQLE